MTPITDPPCSMQLVSAAVSMPAAKPDTTAIPFWARILARRAARAHPSADAARAPTTETLFLSIRLMLPR